MTPAQAIHRQWHAIGASVRGHSHRRSGAPNQDSIATVPGHGSGAMVAIADGHGSETSFRSDFGASTATSIAVQTTRAFVDELNVPTDRDSLLTRAQSEIPDRIVHGWVTRVTEDLAERPFDERELEAVRISSRADAMLALEENPLIAYGATILIAAAIDRSLVLLQLGDGDIVVMLGSDPGVPTRPVPGDPRLIGNQTTSLCLPTAVHDFRVAAVDGDDGNSPSLVVVTTDGYVNSFVDDAAFLQAGPDIASHVREHGLDWVGEQLPSWLENASRLGSGDDITMGLLVRSDLARADPATPAAMASSQDPSTPAPREEGSERKGGPSARSAGAVVPIAIGAAIAGVIAGAVVFSDPAPTPSPDAPVVSTTEPTASSADSDGWVWLGDGRLGARTRDGIGRIVEVESLRGVDVVDVASGFDRVWLASSSGEMFVVDPAHPEQTARIELNRADTMTTQVVVERSSVIVITEDAAVWYSIDPTDLRVDRHENPNRSTVLPTEPTETSTDAGG